MKFISKLSRRERLFFYVSVIAVLLFLLDRFIFSVMLEEIKKIDSDINAMQTELSGDIGILSYQEKITKETEIYGEYLEKEESPEVINRKLQEKVNELASGAGLTVNELKPVSSKDTTKCSVELRVEGEMKNLVNFMYNLNAVSSLLKVEKIDLTPKTIKSAILNIYLTISKTVIP